MPEPFDVSLVTPEREVWSGEATIVIARGTEGELGIMNGHVPVLIQLAIGPLFIEPAGGEERIAAAVDGGFLHAVTSEGRTRVDVLAEFAELAPEIDLEKARSQRDDAQHRLQDPEDAEAAADLLKAETRLGLLERA
jgi:F-type H+-transporting ATPase subunit epsilon